MGLYPSTADYIKGVFDINDPIAKNAPKKQFMRMDDGSVKVFIELPSPKPNRIRIYQYKEIETVYEQ